MSKIRDGASFYKQYNKAQRIEETKRIAEQEAKKIREILQPKLNEPSARR